MSEASHPGETRSSWPLTAGNTRSRFSMQLWSDPKRSATRFSHASAELTTRCAPKWNRSSPHTARPRDFSPTGRRAPAGRRVSSQDLRRGPSRQGNVWASSRSNAFSERAGWARSIAPATRASIAASPSRCCRLKPPPIRAAGRASCTKPGPSLDSRIHAFARCTTSDTMTESTSSSWSTSKAKHWRRDSARDRCRSRRSWRRP